MRMEESTPTSIVEPPMVARRLRALRTALGLSRSEFADAVGIDRSSYTKIENGIKPLLPNYAYKIYQLYGVDMNFIYLGQVGGVPVNLSSKLMTNLAQEHA